MSNPMSRKRPARPIESARDSHVGPLSANAKKLTIRIDDDLHMRVKAYVAIHQTSMTTLVSKLLEEELDRHAN